MDLDPRRGVFRWARTRARNHRGRFGVGSVLLGAFVAVLGVAIHLPSHPTTAQRMINALSGFGIAVGVILIGTLVYALVVAPYEQRNKLRRLLAESQEAHDKTREVLASTQSERDAALKECETAKIRADYSPFTGSYSGVVETNRQETKGKFGHIVIASVSVTGAPAEAESSATPSELPDPAPRNGPVDHRRPS